MLLLCSAFLGGDISAQTSGNIYPIPGSDILIQQWAKIDPAIREKLQNSLKASLPKATAWNFTIGQTRSWWATNMNPSDPNYNKEYSVPSTCKAVGTNCYIFVEDAIWNTRVNQAAVDSIKKAFEVATPANLTKGIYQLATSYFGNPPNVDSDPKIIILILDIKDGFSGSGAYVAGYFYSINQYSEADVQYYLGTSRHSNEAEIFYIDANPANLSTIAGINNAALVTAHEFQHMIHWNYDMDEIAFVDEGMSECASVLCGYQLRSPEDYYAKVNVDFTSWNLTGNPLPDYSRTAMFSWYLIEQFGSDLTKKIVQNKSNGIDGYNAALVSIGSSLRFLDILNNFSIATGLNNKNIDLKYGFTTNISIYPLPKFSYSTTTAATKQDTLEPYGTQYIKFSINNPISVLVSSGGSIIIKGISTGSSSRVESITKGVAYNPSGFGSTYTTLLISVTNQSNEKTIYSFQANTATDVKVSNNIPLTFSLSQNYPNPFNPTTTIKYDIPMMILSEGAKSSSQTFGRTYVSLKIYDILGREVTTLVNEFKEAGSYEVRFNASALPSGIYFYKLEAGHFSSTKKFMLIK